MQSSSGLICGIFEDAIFAGLIPRILNFAHWLSFEDAIFAGLSPRILNFAQHWLSFEDAIFAGLSLWNADLENELSH